MEETEEHPVKDRHIALNKKIELLSQQVQKLEKELRWAEAQNDSFKSVLEFIGRYLNKELR
jgi:hypothetical protein